MYLDRDRYPSSRFPSTANFRRCAMALTALPLPSPPSPLHTSPSPKSSSRPLPPHFKNLIQTASALNRLKSLHIPRSTSSPSSVSAQSRSAKEDLLSLISDQDRGLKTQKDSVKRDAIIKAIDAMADLGRGSVTTGDSLSATWRLLWTTEKEQLFIIEKAYLFGTQTGDVLQVIDVGKGTLNNVITFPPDGVFFVRSTIEIASAQRVNFRYFSSLAVNSDVISRRNRLIIVMDRKP